MRSGLLALIAMAEVKVLDLDHFLVCSLANLLPAQSQTAHTLALPLGDIRPFIGTHLNFIV